MTSHPADNIHPSRRYSNHVFTGGQLDQAAAVEAIWEVLESVPGKTSLIQFTSGVTQTGEDNRSELIAATNSANRSNVSIYTADSRGPLTDTPGGDASDDFLQKS